MRFVSDNGKTIEFEANEILEGLKFLMLEFFTKAKSIEIKFANGEQEIRHELIEELDQTLLLQRYIDNQSYFVSSKLQSGRVANKHCYVVCGIKDRWNEIAVQESARRIEMALRSLSDDAHRCSQAEMEKILVSIFNPLRPEIYVNC